MNDKSSRPALADNNAIISEYDTILLGFPIWWYTAPRIINSFLENYDFDGKNIVLFATSGGSGLGNIAKELALSSPGANIQNGKMLNRRSSFDDIKKIVETL